MTTDNNDRNPCPTPECDGEAVGDDLGPRAECAADEALWRAEYDRYGRREVAERYTREDIESAYSEPSERHKREAMLGSGVRLWSWFGGPRILRWECPVEAVPQVVVTG